LASRRNLASSAVFMLILRRFVMGKVYDFSTGREMKDELDLAIAELEREIALLEASLDQQL